VKTKPTQHGKWPIYPAYKPSGIDWLGEVPEHWEVKRLKWSTAGCINGVWGSDPEGGDLDIICVRVADFNRGCHRVKLDNPTMRAVPIKDRRRRLLQSGDLLLEKSGGGEKTPVGTVMLYDHDTPAVCSNFIARMPLVGGFYSSFVVYVHAMLYSGAINTRSIKQSTGIQNLSSRSYLDEQIAFPPLPEQRAIAAFLDERTAKIDALIEAKRELLVLLKEKRQALITHAVTKGLDPDAKMKPSGVEWLGEVPEHWSHSKVRFVFHNLDRIRIPLSSEVRGGLNKVYPYYGASGIIDYVDDYLFDQPHLLVAEDGANLLSRSTPLAFIASGKYWVNNHAHILSPRSGSLKYWEGVLQSYDFSPQVSGAAQPKLTSESLGSIPVPLPPKDERNAIALFLDEQTTMLDGIVDETKTAIDCLTEYRTALISAAVTGKIDVRGSTT